MSPEFWPSTVADFDFLSWITTAQHFTQTRLSPSYSYSKGQHPRSPSEKPTIENDGERSEAGRTGRAHDATAKKNYDSKLSLSGPQGVV